jgi:tetratricopeptide (TPR) repeat protein
LTQLAELLFEFSDDNPSAQERKGLSAIMKGTGGLSFQQSEQTKVVLHLGQAIDAQTKGNEAQAAEEMEHALDAGFKHPSLYFALGLLRFKGERLESAQRFLQNAVKHNDYALATRLVLGQLLVNKSRFNEASLEYLEALKLADATTVPAEKSDEISQQYEPLIEAHENQKDETILRKVCENINGLLMRPDWREQLHKTREQMPRQEGDMIAPLADVILQAQSSSVLESMNRVNHLARMGSLRSAMDLRRHALRLLRRLGAWAWCCYGGWFPRFWNRASRKWSSPGCWKRILSLAAACKRGAPSSPRLIEFTTTIRRLKTSRPRTEVMLPTAF